MFNTRIYRQPGGSEMTFGSGASLNLLDGAVFSNAGTVSGATDHSDVQTFSGGASFTSGASFASSSVKLGADIASSGVIGVFEVMDFGNGVKFFLARTQNAPSAAGSPGSLMIRLPGTGTPSSVVDLYIKRGDNSPASGNWVAFQTTASAG